MPIVEPFADWVDDHLHVVQKRSTDNWVVDRCIICGRAKKLEVNVRKCVWRCWTCDSRGNAVTLIAEVTGVSIKEAFRRWRRMKTGGDPLRAPRPGRPRSLEGASSSPREADVTDSATLAEAAEARDAEAAGLVVPLPKEFVRCYDEKRPRKWMVPQYLRDRGVPRGMLRKFEIGYCPAGRYAERAVVPVRTLGMQTFVARSMVKKRDPKYLTPGGFHARLLFGYDLVPRGARVVIVEGVFDAIRLCQWGHHGLGLQGKELSEDQAALIRRLAPASVVFMLDPDAAADAHRAAASFALDCPALVAPMTGDRDPGESTQGELGAAIAAASPTDGRLDALGIALGELRGM